MSSNVILHHYNESPAAEKIRVILGMKNLSWQSVLIPRLPPKPNLTALTGGYRLTPVMQIGSDIYCDTKCIIRELENRYPSPTLFPEGSHGMAWGISCWTDGPLFTTVLSVVFAKLGKKMSPNFLNDRSKLYFGDSFNLDKLQRDYQNNLSKIRTQFGWMDERLAAKKFMLGNNPGLPDALTYHLYWFLKDRIGNEENFFLEFEN